jgi:hypothetical protein
MSLCSVAVNESPTRFVCVDSVSFNVSEADVPLGAVEETVRVVGRGAGAGVGVLSTVRGRGAGAGVRCVVRGAGFGVGVNGAVLSGTGCTPVAVSP